MRPTVFSRRLNQAEKVLIIMAAAFLLGCVLAKGCAHRAEVNMAAIMQIESSGRHWVVANDGGVGLYQLMPCVLEEYNHFHGTWWSKKDLFDPRLNYVIAAWYLTVRIPQMLVHYRKPVTTKNIIICYNAGIRAVVRGYVPATTKLYLKRYERLTGKEVS